MNTINGIMFAILLLIAVVIEIRLLRSNINGFKKILQGFFGAEIWLSFGLLIFECTDYGVQARLVTQWFLFILFLPKVYYKIRFFLYIHKNN